ncbi:MAG: hypothetical protein PUF04_09440 [bacterium]|nr:hypothetical protein [bacterium]
MSFDVSYFRAIQNAIGHQSERDAIRAETQARIADDFSHSINYDPHLKRNGVLQPMIVTTTESTYKYRVLARPGDDLCVGDLLEFSNRHWIVTEINSVDLMNFEGIAWECNNLFVLQKFDGTIYKRWGVLDSGVYSTTQRSTEQLSVPDKQYKIYLPLDEDTETIYIDQRVATERMYNRHGEPILVVYRITARDSVSSSYGNGGHLLVLAARSDLFNAATDDYDLGICDYKQPPLTPPSEAVGATLCEIVGKSIIRLGFGPRTYRAIFRDSDGNEESFATPEWSIYHSTGRDDMVMWSVDNGILTVEVQNDPELIGTYLALSVTDNEHYRTTEMKVEVTAVD